MSSPSQNWLGDDYVFQPFVVLMGHKLPIVPVDFFHSKLTKFIASLLLFQKCLIQKANCVLVSELICKCIHAP